MFSMRDAAAIGRGGVVGDLMLVSVRLALPWSRMPPPRAVGAVRVGGAAASAVDDGEALQRHGKPAWDGGIEEGVDVEDAIEVVAIDHDRAAAGIRDRQVAAAGQDDEVAGGVAGVPARRAW